MTTTRPGLRLWRYNQTTGYWNYERSVTPETAEQWLAVFQKDEPTAYFKVSRHKPNGKPEGYDPPKIKL